MGLPQPGIFAVGTAAHAYLELDLVDGAEARDLVGAVADLSVLRTTIGVNLVSGVGPEMWAAVAPGSAPAGLNGFASPVVGQDGFTMPATQHDVALWVAGASYDVVFDAAAGMVAALADVAVLQHEVVGWTYHRDLDLTGFVDGTENPPLSDAPREVLVPAPHPGAGGSVLLLQTWLHDAAAWAALPETQQEQVMGRTKPGSVELEDKPDSSHVARTDQEDFGHIFRRNTAFGSLSRHGTVFVGFSAAQSTLAAMLDSMAGVEGVRDELTRYASPLTGGYYFVPSLEDLAAFATPVE